MLKPKKKITRQEIKKDPVLEWIAKAENYIRENGKLLSYVALGVVVVAVVSVLLMRSKRTANLEAAGKLGIAEMALTRGDYENALIQLEDLVDTYKGTRSADIATLLLAQTHLDQGEYESAEGYFRDYIDARGADPLMLASAYNGLGICAENHDDMEGAAAYFAKAAGKATYKFQEHEYGINQARSLIKLGKIAEAESLVQHLLEDEPEYQNRNVLERLSARISVLKG